MKRAQRIAVVGAGAFGRQHLSALQAIAGVETVAVVDPSPARLAYAARRFSVPNHFADLTTMLQSCAVDAISLVTPPGQHVEQVELAVAQGCAVLVEKPVAMSADKVERIAALAGPALVMPAHVLRFTDAATQARESIGAGQLGRVLGITASRDRGTDHFDRFGAIGLARMTMVHDVDLALWLTEDSPTHVSAVAVTEGEPPKAEVLDVRVRSASGGVWALRASWLGPRRDMCHECVVHGSDTHLRVRPSDRDLRSALGRELAHFLACARGEARLRVTITDAWWTLAVADAIDRSLSAGGADVEVALPPRVLEAENRH